MTRQPKGFPSDATMNHRERSSSYVGDDGLRRRPYIRPRARWARPLTKHQSVCHTQGLAISRSREQHGTILEPPSSASMVHARRRCRDPWKQILGKTGTNATTSRPSTTPLDTSDHPLKHEVLALLQCFVLSVDEDLDSRSGKCATRMHASASIFCTVQHQQFPIQRSIVCRDI